VLCVLVQDCLKYVLGRLESNTLEDPVDCRCEQVNVGCVVEAVLLEVVLHCIRLHLLVGERVVVEKGEEMLLEVRRDLHSLSAEVGTAVGGHKGVSDAANHRRETLQGVRVVVNVQESVALDDCLFF